MHLSVKNGKLDSKGVAGTCSMIEGTGKSFNISGNVVLIF